jgi:hypothetical protein
MLKFWMNVQIYTSFYTDILPVCLATTEDWGYLSIRSSISLLKCMYSKMIPPPQPVTISQTRQRFCFNVCPFPERCVRSAQDQDDEVEAARHDEEEPKKLG